MPEGWICPCLLSSFTEVAEAALAPLREMGAHTLSCLTDWLLSALLRLGGFTVHRDMLPHHPVELGLQVSWERVSSPLGRASLFFFFS